MSIKDFRLIEFDEDAVRGAIGRCTRQSASLGLNGDLIAAMEFLPDRQEVIVHTRVGNQRRATTLHSARLAALLIGYCAILRVPVPRRAAKRVEVMADRLRISMTQVVLTGDDATPAPVASGAPTRSMVWK